MNLPTSTTRGFFEILMPGIFLLLNLLVTGFILPLALIPDSTEFLNSVFKFISSPAIGITLAIVLGYPIGVVLRLKKNENIDQSSVKYIKLIQRLKGKNTNRSYLNDAFFFNNWMYSKTKKRLPLGAFRFYEEFWYDKDRGEGRSNTTFFNFCKTVIAKVDPQSANDIFAAEALSRFVAGSYYALVTSSFLMFLNSIFLKTKFSWQVSILPILVIVGYSCLLHVILSQFRLLRCKEVDIVFNACYANRDEFEKLFPKAIDKRVYPEQLDDDFNARQALIKAIWTTAEMAPNKHSLKLDALVKEMKEQSKTNSKMSSMYFAGSYIDQPFFLENDKIALGLAVLPEDKLKAGRKKRHPNQTEIIVVLDGSINLFIQQLGKGKIVTKVLHTHDNAVIAPNTCHWITLNKTVDGATYLFVKTNPAEEPVAESCNDE